MCRTYNTIGSLTSLKLHLEDNNIYDFKSLKEVIDFQNSYPTFRQQIITTHKELIEQEKNSLLTDLQELDSTIEIQKQQAAQKLISEIDKLKQDLDFSVNNGYTNFFQKLRKNYIQWNCKRKIKNIESNFDLEVTKSFKNLVDIRKVKN